VTDIAGGAEDLRVQRSRASIQRALFELTVEKGYASVTVRDIALRARVNRSTFYRHYLDKDDLLDQYLDQLQGHVAEAAARAEQARGTLPERVPAGLLLLVQHVQEHAAFYRVMLGKDGDQAFSHRFRGLSEQRYRHLFARAGRAPNSHSPPAELQLHYISAAFVGAVLWWLEHNFPCTAEQFALWLGQLSMTSAGLTLP
jgi:AcrR family transcriptional regulator